MITIEGLNHKKCITLKHEGPDGDGGRVYQKPINYWGTLARDVLDKVSDKQWIERESFQLISYLFLAGICSEEYGIGGVYRVCGYPDDVIIVFVLNGIETMTV